MSERKTMTNKLLLLGCDGMDPRLTRKYVDMGVMPHVKQFIERGACRHDLVLLGGHPTVTPPMWTTLACGCYANVHGITGFFRKGNDIDEIEYNFDSRKCLAEPLWNVFAEAGKKTLVWHWPGSAWPPTSESPNLMVVDGTSPGSVGMAVAQVEFELFVGASEEIPEVTFLSKIPMEAHAACVVTNLKLEDDGGDNLNSESLCGEDAKKSHPMVMYKESQKTTNITEAGVDLVQSPIKPASGWLAAPEEAKEFTILMSHGLVRRPALILPNSEGIYDRVAVYKTKKDLSPLVVLEVGKIVTNIIDEAIKDDRIYRVNRNMKLLRLDPQGKTLTMHISGAMDTENDSVWHPKRLFQAVAEHVGYPTPTSQLGRQDSMLITECMLDNWNVTADWQAKAMHYVIEAEGIEVVFSHYHAIDLQGHMFTKHLAERPFNRQPVTVAEKWMQDLYIQADNYLGQFLHFLDEGWTIFIFSDHGLVAPAYGIPDLIDAAGVMTPLMEEMGYTVLERDENGQRLGKIDWSKTRAVLQREGHIYINLKGKYDHGIVEPTDQYELEEQIMTDLYSLRDKESGHRIVALALRNRDAVLLGMGGPECGDIICWHAEGYNFDHDDCLSTTWGEGDTSVSPLFIAAGTGIKAGFETDRIIREVDVAPTAALLGGVRMPKQCEGAPVYQILSEEW